MVLYFNKDSVTAEIVPKFEYSSSISKIVLIHNYRMEEFMCENLSILQKCLVLEVHYYFFGPFPYKFNKTSTR